MCIRDSGSLTDDQKDYVTAETIGTLVLAEEQIAKLLEAAAVDELIKEIEALPTAENVTLENETAIANALAHYNALSEDQKKNLEEKFPDSLTKLNDVIDRLNVLKEEAADQKAVDEVNEKLNALPAAEDILFADETAVTEARNAYEALDEIKEGLKDREMCIRDSHLYLFNLLIKFYKFLYHFTSIFFSYR